MHYSIDYPSIFSIEQASQLAIVHYTVSSHLPFTGLYPAAHILHSSTEALSFTSFKQLLSSIAIHLPDETLYLGKHESHVVAEAYFSHFEILVVGNLHSPLSR